MAEELLLELEAVEPSVERLDHLVREARQQEAAIGLGVERMRGSAQQFENAWRQIVLNVAQGRTGEMHAVRSRLLAALDKRLSLINDAYALAKWLHTLGSVHVSDPDILLPEIARIECLKTDVFNRWQTEEDLEDLAARDYPLTTTQLDQIGPTQKPPASFYAEESKPF